MHINPDHYLQTDHGRIFTPERNAGAWKRAYSALDHELVRLGTGSSVFVLVGAQGSGKSTWARSYAAKHPNAIIFDAILVQRVERAAIVSATSRVGGLAVAVWFKTPLNECIARNMSRPADEICSERAVRNVYAALEAPTTAEGFAEIVEID